MSTSVRRHGPDPWRDVVEGTVTVGDRELSFVHPREAMDLMSEEDFAREEFIPYWAQLWSSGIALANALPARFPDHPRVLELGCGIGLPSVAAALAGGQVFATDWCSDALEFAEANARRNGTSLTTVVCSWGEPAPMVQRGPWDLILAADVLYENRNVSWLLDLLPSLVAGSGEVWLADPRRRTAEAFLTAVDTEGLGWQRVTTADTRFPEVHIHRLRRA